MTRDRGKGIARRKFLTTAGAGIAGATLVSKFSKLTVAAPVANSSQRRVFPLNHKWLYSEKNVTGGTSPHFNDAGFVRVTIPHTNKLLPWHGFDDLRGFSRFSAFVQTVTLNSGSNIEINLASTMSAYYACLILS